MVSDARPLPHLLRTIRLDPSDTFVFDRAAVPGEWAIVGSFLFWEDDHALLTGKRLAAFRAGFAGIGSLGHSTLAVVVKVTPDERRAAEAALAATLIDRTGAPDLATAMPAACEEIAFAASLAQQPVGTLIALHRSFEDGAVKEQVRTLHRRTAPEPGQDPMHWRVFTTVVVDDEDEPLERIDFDAMLHGAGRDEPR